MNSRVHHTLTHQIKPFRMQPTCMSAVHVGEALLNQTALLLPDVFDYFHEKLREITKLCGIILEQEVHNNANSTWLRGQLTFITF